MCGSAGLNCVGLWGKAGQKLRPATRSQLHSPRGDITGLWLIAICSEHLVPYAKEQWKEIFLGYIYDCAEPQSMRYSLAILLVCVRGRGKQYFGIEAGHRYVDISAFHEAVTSSSATHFGGCPDRQARTLGGNLTGMSDVRHGCGPVAGYVP